MHITICLTSCNKFNSLKRTLDSFFLSNSYPIHKFLIIEDSGNTNIQKQIISNYGDRVEVIFNDHNIGQLASIDKVYNLVDSEYIFHCEDDWTFTGMPGFIEKSLDILEERKDIHQVWVRSCAPGHRDNLNRVIEPKIYDTLSGTKYKLVMSPHDTNWCGFSWNPGLRRLSDYKRMFPNGFSPFAATGTQNKHELNAISECYCSKHAMTYGYRAATLLEEYCFHNS